MVPVHTVRFDSGVLEVFRHELIYTPGMLAAMFSDRKTIRISAISKVVLRERDLDISARRGPVTHLSMHLRYDANPDAMRTAAAFIEQRRQEMSQPRPGPGTPPVGIGDQLTKLADLKSKGLLTDDEFVAAKRKLLR